MVEAANRSGAFMPTDIVTPVEFAERLRRYPQIEGIVMGCVVAQASEAGLITGFWLPRLVQTLAELRRLMPKRGAA